MIFLLIQSTNHQLPREMEKQCLMVHITGSGEANLFISCWKLFPLRTAVSEKMSWNPLPLELLRTIQRSTFSWTMTSVQIAGNVQYAHFWRDWNILGKGLFSLLNGHFFKLIWNSNIKTVLWCKWKIGIDITAGMTPDKQIMTKSWSTGVYWSIVSSFSAYTLIHFAPFFNSALKIINSLVVFLSG